MSMCLYLKAGPELELARLARDGEALANLAMSRLGGGGGTITPIDEFTMARLSRKMQERAERFHGPEVAQLMKAAHERLQQRMEELARLHGPQVAELMKPAIAHLQQKQDGSQTAKAGVSTGAAAHDRAAGAVLDLHKSWHVLHFLFTGSAGEAAAPGGALLSGGREIGEDLGYGPARLLDAAATKAFATFLAPLTTEKLTQRLDVKNMGKLGVYGVAPDVDEVQEEVAEYFPMLQDYVEKAAARGDGLLVWMM